MVEQLNQFSVLLYRHLLVGLRGKKRLLLATPLGRQRLFAAGFRSIVLRPVTRDGWSRHVFAVSASERGDWTLHDPMSLVRKPNILWGALPGITHVEEAYVVVIRPKIEYPCKKNEAVVVRCRAAALQKAEAVDFNRETSYAPHGS